MIWISRGRRLPLTIALLIGLIVIGVIVNHTHSAKPPAGATYTGTVFVETAAGKVIQRLPISFGVARSGRRVGAFRFPDGLPRACSARRLGAVSPETASAAVRLPGRFEINLALAGSAGSGTVAGRVGTLQISGTFHSFSRDSGAVATRYGSSGRRGCDASGGYTAKAVS